VKNAAENKKPATSEIAGCGLPKSELYLSYVGRITHPASDGFDSNKRTAGSYWRGQKVP
jgi:hypothetical protein